MTRDDGSLEYFQSHSFGIGDPANRELTIEELEALVPEEQRNLEAEDERRMIAGKESLFDELLHQGKFGALGSSFAARNNYQHQRREPLRRGRLLQEFYNHKER